jgi:hypothetical protein
VTSEQDPDLITDDWSLVTSAAGVARIGSGKMTGPATPKHVSLLLTLFALIGLLFVAPTLRRAARIENFRPLAPAAPAAKQRPPVLRRERAVLRAVNMNLLPPPTVAINEVCAGGVEPFRSVFRQPHDWVELYNTTDREIALAGYSLTDTRLNPRRWRFPDVRIAPHDYLLVWLSGLVSDEHGSVEGRGELHAPFQLSPDGEFLALYNARGAVEDYLTVPPTPHGMTYARPVDGRGTFRISAPSPLGKRLAQPPAADVASGIFDQSFTVRLTADGEGAEIRYTRDGSEPSPAAARYAGPIAITNTTVLRARAFAPGRRASTVVTRFYWMEPAPPGVPLLSLVVDPQDLTSKERGILVNPSRYGMKWERPAWVTFIEDGTVAFEGPSGIRLQGRTTRRQPKKSLKLFFRSAYGLAECPYDMIEPGSGLTARRITVRAAANIASGEEWRAGLRDTQFFASPLGFAMMRACGVRAPRTRYVVVVLNGKVHGVCYLVEDFDPHYLVQEYGHDDFDLLKLATYRPMVAGSYGSYQNLKLWVRQTTADRTLNDEEVYRELARGFDLDSLTRWAIVTAFTQVRDHKQGFYALNRRQHPLQWHLLAWDMDSAFRHDRSYPAGAATWEFNKLRELQLIPRDLRGRLLSRLIPLPRYQRAYAERLQDLVNHRLCSGVWIPELERSAQLLLPLAEYEERGDRNRRRTYSEEMCYAARIEALRRDIREFLTHRPEAILRVTAEYFDMPAPQPLHIESTGGGAVMLGEHLLDTDFAGLYYPGTDLELSARPAGDVQFSHWELGEERREGRTLRWRLPDAPTRIRAVFRSREPAT